MSEDHLDDLGQELHRKLARERRRAGGTRRWRCSTVLRSRVVAYAVACVANGESHGGIAVRLGLTQSTLSRWIREAGESDPGFRSVAIVPSEQKAARPLPFTVRLLTPHGFVVEGLDPELLVSLLQVLG